MKTKKEVAKKVHFTVDPQWATDFARERWSEGAYAWCYEFVLSCGVKDIKTIRDILWGKKKMVLWKEGVDNVFTLAPDNWKPSPKKSHLCQYPNPHSPSEMREAEEVIFKEKAKQSMSVWLSEIEEERTHLRMDRNRIDAQQEKLNNILDIGLKRYMESDAVNDEVVKAEKIQPSDVYENGIITPDGKFYRCGSMGHNLVAIALGYAEDNSQSETSGVADAIEKGCVTVTCNLALKMIRKPKKVTKAQRATIAKWYALVSYSKLNLLQVDY